MTIDNEIALADDLLFKDTGQRLTTLEKLVLQAALEHKSYKTLAASTYRSPKTLKDIGSQLWRKLSQAFETPVKKNTVGAALERYQRSLQSAQTQPSHRRDWADAPEAQTFFGRQEELATLNQWILRDRCRLVAIVGMRGIGKTGLTVRLGMGGIGKTDLSLKLARGIQDDFDYVIWRSLLNAPSVEVILRDFIQFLSNHQEAVPSDIIDAQLLLLLKLLKQQRCLLILDNFESVLVGSKSDQNDSEADPQLLAGQYQKNYEGYGQLVQKISEVPHQSCLIITSRESPKYLRLAASKLGKTRLFQLPGLKPEDAKLIFSSHQISIRQDSSVEEIISFYEGNPLALNLALKRIQNAFNGSISDFFQQDNLLFEDINDLLKWHIERLDEPEREILYWLAINREPTSIPSLKEDFYSLTLREASVDVLEALQLRLPISKTLSGFTLQPVIIEYLTAKLVKKIVREIESGNIDLLHRLGLQKTSSKAYVRGTQNRLLIMPIVDRLLQSLGQQSIVIDRLDDILRYIKVSPRLHSGYAAANLIAILCALEADLTGYDFSQLTIRQAHLQDITLKDVNFAYANLSTARFTQAFGGIHSLAFSPDGELLAVGDSKGRIQLLRCGDYRQVRLLIGHVQNLWITSVAFAKTQPLLASGGFDQTIKLWDTQTGSCLKTLEGHTQWIWTIALSPDGHLVASGGDDSTVRVWDVDTGRCINSLTDHSNWVWAVAFSPDGKTLATGSYDRTIRLWDVATGTCLHVLEGHENSVWALAFSPDGEMLASGSLDFTVRLWQVKSQACIGVLTGHTMEVRSIAFAPDGRYLVSGSFDGTLKRWDVATGQCLTTFSGHSVGIRTVAVSPDGQTIASGDHAQYLRMWEPFTGYCLQAIKGYVNWVWSVAIHPQGTLIASGSLDGYVRLWSVQTGECVRTLDDHGNWVWQVAFSPDGRLLASCGDDETIKLWDLDSGVCLSTLRGHRNGGVWAIGFIPNQDILVSGGQDGTLRFWNLRTAQEIHLIEAHENWIWSLTFNPQGNLLASCSDDGTIGLWDVQTRQVIHQLSAIGRKVLSLEWIGAQSILASGHDDGQIRLWDTTTGQLIRELKGHQGWVLALLFEPATNRLISAAQDRTIRVWELETAACHQVLSGHQDWVTSLSLCREENLLISGSTDESIKIWDLQSWQCMHSLALPLPYDGMNITQALGLNDSQKANLQSLGAIIATN